MKQLTRETLKGDAHFEQLREDAVVLDIFVAYLEQAEHVDLLFHIVDVYTYWNTANHVGLSRFINRHVALSTDVPFKLRILDRFIEIFENGAVSKACVHPLDSRGSSCPSLVPGPRSRYRKR